MSRKKSTSIRIDGGQECPRCHGSMQRFQHGTDWQPRPGHYWDRCDPCGHTQHYEAAKVHAAPPMSASADIESMHAHFRNI